MRGKQFTASFACCLDTLIEQFLALTFVIYANIIYEINED